MKKKILFVTYGGGHAPMVCPIVHKLRESSEYKVGELQIKVLSLPAAKQILKSNQIECFGFDDYLDEKIDADAIEWGTELAKTNHSPHTGASIQESIAYLGLSFKDLVVRFGKEEADKLFKEKARHSFHPITIMERIFDDIKPDFVVATNSPRAEAAAIEVANARGIENLIVTDLFSGLKGYVLRANHVTFINEFAYNMFKDNKLLDDNYSNFHFTGSPAFDKIIKMPKTKDSEWICKNFPESVGKNIILHADMPAYVNPISKNSYFKTDSEIIEEINACYEATLKNDAIYLIRPHPSQNRDIYKNWLNGKNHAFLASDFDLHELLCNVDIVIARSTTVILEAIYMEKRVIQLDYDFHTDMPLVKIGVAWGINSYSELENTIKNALCDDKKLEEIRNSIKKNLPLELASPKIVDLILRKVTSNE